MKRYQTYGAIFDMVYVALVTNLLLVAGCAPLVVGVMMSDPARSWPYLAVVSPLCTPALCAVFGVMAAYSADRSTMVLRTFVRVWRASFRRAAALGALVTALIVVLAVDARAAWGHQIGAVVIPLLVVLMVLTVATGLLVVVALAERPKVRLRRALVVCAYLAVRRWYLTAVSLAVCALLEALLASRPAIALGVAAAPLLYVVWANSRFTLRPALDRPKEVSPGARAVPATPRAVVKA